MIPDDIQARLRERSQHYRGLRVHVLVDGIQFHRHTHTVMQAQAGSVTALFAGTADERLAPAGPWLVDPARAKGLACLLADMEPERPGVIWLIAPHEIDEQANVLRRMIGARLPDGRELMVRFWDPRALVSFYHSFSRERWNAHFGGVLEWLFLHEGKRTYIESHA